MRGDLKDRPLVFLTRGAGMGDNSKCGSDAKNNHYFRPDSFLTGGLLIILAVDIVVYLLTHVPNISKTAGIEQVTVEYYVLKQVLIWGTALLATAAIPTTLYYAIRKNFPDTKKLLKLFCFILSALITLAFIIIMYFPERLFGLLTPLITVYFVSMGWWIQSMTAARSNRRSHTLNTILSTRTNEVYQRNLRGYEQLVPEGFFIDRKICEIYVNRDKFYELSREKTSDELVEEHMRESIANCAYMLNYFEFIAEGIQSEDLDEQLIRDCFFSFFKNMDKRLCYFIVEVRKRHPTAFSAFVEIVERWHGSSQSKIHENTDNEKTLGIKVPSDKNKGEIAKEPKEPKEPK